MKHTKTPKEFYRLFDSVLLEAAINPDPSFLEEGAFSRHRKIGLYDTLWFISTLQEDSVRHHSWYFLKSRHINATPSAYCQARNKFDHRLTKQACLAFTKHISSDVALLKGKYRPLGVDGSNFSILPNPDEPQNRVPGREKDHYALHFNAAYDLINRFYVNYLVQSAADKNEHAAALYFVHQDCGPGIPIWTGDRLYVSYELLTQIQEAGHRFLLRAKENNFLQLLESWQSLRDPMDFETSRMLISTQKAETRCLPELYKYVPKGKVSAITEEHPEFFLAFRLLCVTLETLNEETGETETSYEYLITNLDQNEFSTEEIKELYHLRWNIETSFRDLKCVLKAEQVHSRKQNLIEQEIDMAVMVYNLVRAISKCASVPQKGRKYEYQTNFTALTEVVLKFLNREATQKDVIWTIQNATEPIRKNRHFKRGSPTTVKTSHWK